MIESIILSRSNRNDLQTAMNYYEKDGWRPQGGVAVLPVFSNFVGEAPKHELLHTMVRDREEEHNEEDY